jgi:hypothetical protein
MPIFECSKCHCAENTAVGDYWVRHSKGKPVLCSECSTGKWHGHFEKRSAVGMLIDQAGGLWTRGQVDGGVFPEHYKIVGKVETPKEDST